MFDIRGKVAFVTGGASGIGLATVEQLLHNGLKGATIADINEKQGQKAVEDLGLKFGSQKVLFVKVNVANRNEFQEALIKTVEVFENLDIVINAAGICKDLKWEEEIAVNLGGTVTGTVMAFEEYLPKYKTGSEGVIMNFASSAALQAIAFCPIYCATKSGVVQLTRCYGSDFHRNRQPVRVLAVCPGYTKTQIIDWQPDKHLKPDYYEIEKQEIADAVAQSAEHVAKSVVSLIQEGQTGSIWLVESGKIPEKVEFSY